MISIEMDHNENEINNNNVEHPEVFLETLEQDLLDREYCDLSQLTAEEQYQIIKEKSGQHENSMIPAEGEKGDLLSSLQRSKDSGVPLRIKV